MTKKLIKTVADASKASVNNKKIYITSLHLLHGGVEMVISSLANAFAEKGYDVEVLCIYRLGEPAYFFDKRVRITYLTDVHPNREEFRAAVSSKNPFKILKEAFYAVKVLRLKTKSIKEAISKIEEGTIISTRTEHSVLLSKFGRNGVLKIAQLHHDHKFDKKLLNDFKFKYENIDYFTLLTPQMTEEVKSAMEQYNHTTKCVTVPNFLFNFPEATDADRKDQVVSVGRFSPEKGFLRLLDAWKEFVSVHPDWCLKLIGDGAERKALENKVVDFGLTDSVVFTGMLPNDQVIGEMSASKVYAMSSFTEALPMVIIEAGVCGLPAVAFDVRVGPRALVEDGKTGLLVEDGNISAFATALATLADDDALRYSMGESARENAQYYSKDNIMKMWIDIIEGHTKGEN